MEDQSSFMKGLEQLVWPLHMSLLKGIAKAEQMARVLLKCCAQSKAGLHQKNKFFISWSNTCTWMIEWNGGYTDEGQT